MSELTEHAVNGVDPRLTLLGFGSSSTTVTGSVGVPPRSQLNLAPAPSTSIVLL